MGPETDSASMQQTEETKPRSFFSRLGGVYLSPGETFREIIFFRTNGDLEVFMTGEFTFSAQATAVAVDAGAAAKANYRDGIAIFIMASKGLMVDASVGGQKFKYLPK